MSILGPYCKAYPICDFRAFRDWKEPEERKFGDEEILFLQEDYTVTDNIYLAEGVIFDDTTTEWRAFCNQTLGFQIPAYDAT